MKRIVPANRSTFYCLAFLLGVAGCSAGPKEMELLPLTLSQEPLVAEEESETELADAAGSREVPRVPKAQPTPIVGGGEDGTIVVIVAGGSTAAVTPGRLLAASRDEKARRARIEPVAVITNRNLKESGEGGQVTTATVSKREVAVKLDEESVEEESGLDEEYWRAQALHLRLSWKTAVEDVERLRADVATLRQQFFAEDDVFYRDNEIKPAWDQALENLAAVRGRAEDYQQRLDLLMEEGRRAGALPGWLREGLEYEPQKPATKASRRRQDDPREPKIVDETEWP